MNGGVLTNGTFRVEVGRRTEEVAIARHAIADYLLARGVSSTLVDDFELVTSELVTNAVMHGRRGPISVVMHVADELELRVTNKGSVRGIPAVEEWQPAAPLARRGRGLGIVRRLCDRVRVEGDDTTATVICWRRLPDSGSPA